MSSEKIRSRGVITSDARRAPKSNTRWIIARSAGSTCPWFSPSLSSVLNSSSETGPGRGASSSRRKIPRERMNEIGEHRQRPRRDPGHRCRKSKRERLRRNVAEQKYDHEHGGRRDDRSPFVAEPRQQNDRREAVGEDVARLVQADDDDQRLERPAHQAVERALHGLAHLLARMLQPRHREQRGLGRGQHGAQHDEDQDRKGEDGDHQFHLAARPQLIPSCDNRRAITNHVQPLAPNDRADSPHPDPQATRQFGFAVAGLHAEDQFVILAAGERMQRSSPISARYAGETGIRDASISAPTPLRSRM